jgi:hypothetical protein
MKSRYAPRTEVAPTPRSPVLLHDWLAFLVIHPLLLVCVYDFTHLYFRYLAIEWRKNYSNRIEYALLATSAILRIYVYFVAPVTRSFLVVLECRGYRSKGRKQGFPMIPYTYNCEEKIGHRCVAPILAHRFLNSFLARPGCK